jgi:hypothetical protein
LLSGTTFSGKFFGVSLTLRFRLCTLTSFLLRALTSFRGLPSFLGLPGERLRLRLLAVFAVTFLRVAVLAAVRFEVVRFVRTFRELVFEVDFDALMYRYLSCLFGGFDRPLSRHSEIPS